MFCLKCGQSIPDESKFCMKCGTILPEPMSGSAVNRSDTDDSVPMADSPVGSHMDADLSDHTSAGWPSGPTLNDMIRAAAAPSNWYATAVVGVLCFGGVVLYTCYSFVNTRPLLWIPLALASIQIVLGLLVLVTKSGNLLLGAALASYAQALCDLGFSFFSSIDPTRFSMFCAIAGFFVATGANRTADSMMHPPSQAALDLVDRLSKELQFQEKEQPNAIWMRDANFSYYGRLFDEYLVLQAKSVSATVTAPGQRPIICPRKSLRLGPAKSVTDTTLETEIKLGSQKIRFQLMLLSLHRLQVWTGQTLLSKP